MAPIRLAEMVLRGHLKCVKAGLIIIIPCYPVEGAQQLRGLISPALDVEAGEPASGREKSYDGI